MDSNVAIIHKAATKLAEDTNSLIIKLQNLVESGSNVSGVDPFVYSITIFVLYDFS